jgi:Kef-type K+ transport system membrane component KefB
MSLGFVVLVIFVVQPLMRRLASIADERGALSQGMMGIVLLCLLGSAAATDAIGIHTLIGAFALGVTIPHDRLLARELIHKLEDLVVVLFLPAYFAFTGMRTEIGLIGSGGQWLLCGVIVCIASMGKFGGVTLAARLSGIRWQDSAALGILMNTRGLMELIVLNIGYDLGVISPTLFAMLVVMAVVTTLATTPIFHVFSRSPATE